MIKKLTFSLLCCASIAFAVDKPQEQIPQKPAGGHFYGKGDLGLLSMRGNSESTTLNAKLGLNYDINRFENSFSALSRISSANGTLNGRRYEFQGQVKWYLRPRVEFFYGLSELILDDFSAYESRFTNSIGYGQRLWDSGSVTFDVQGGPGFTTVKRKSDGHQETDLILYTQANLQWHISKTVIFGQKVSDTISDKNSYIQSVTSLTTQLMKNFSSTVSYTINHNTSLPDGSANLRQTDFILSVALGYSFG